MPRSTPAEQPIEVVRRFLATYTNYRRSWNRPAGSPTVVAVDALDVERLPQQIREQADRYRQRHPDETLEFVQHMRVVNGDPVLVAERDDAVPDESSLVTFGVAVTVASEDELDVVVDVVIARSGPRGEHDG
jgi:hypothetical protein